MIYCHICFVKTFSKSLFIAANMFLIKNVVNISENVHNHYQETLNYLNIKICDNENGNIIPYILPYLRFMRNNHDSNNPTLVHCQFGKSRSAIFVILYLIFVYKKTFDEAYQIVKNEMENAIKKDRMLNESDAKLISEFIKKLNKELAN